MKNLLLFVLLAVATNCVNSQTAKTPKTEFAKMYLPVWQEAAGHCLEVALAMPEEKYGYKPTGVSKTFAEQMVHIASATKLLTQRYVEGLEVKPNTPDANGMTKEEIIALLKINFEYTTKIIQHIDKSQLTEKCKMYHSGNEVSRAFAFFYVQDHLTNHRAKANLYIRMNDLEPPSYTW